MNNSNHFRGGKEIREVVAEAKAEPTVETQTHHVAKETLEFYLSSANYTEVYIVRCDACGNDLCLEVLEPATQHKYMETHHQGRRRITLGFDEAPDGYLLSHRKRLDGAMGYQCICGNDTIISPAEKTLSRKAPSGKRFIPPLEPHQEAFFRAKQARSNFKPDVEENGDSLRVETFTVERLK